MGCKPRGPDSITVAELKALLDKFPDDMQVITSRYSDYDYILEKDFSVVSAVPEEDWIMRSHPTMSQERKDKEKEYLHLVGN